MNGKKILTQAVAVFSFLIIFPTLGSAATVSIGGVEPVEAVVDHSFSTDVTYQTQGVNENSCTLSIVGTLPTNWDAGSSISVSNTSGSSKTVSSPKITAQTARETDVTVELKCETDTGTEQDQASFHPTVKEAPSLDASLKSTDSINTGAGETYTVEFTASNTASETEGTDTSNAKVLVSGPSSYQFPDTVTIQEAGQPEGVVRAGRSTGTLSFEFQARSSPTDGTLTLEFTSSRIGVSDTIKITLNAPSEEGRTGGPTEGVSMGPTLPSQTKFWANITPGVVKQMEINKTEELGVKQISVSVKNKANNVKITVTKQVGKPADVEVNVSGKAYRYMKVEAQNLNESNTEEARTQFPVNKSWIRKNNIDPNKVYLNRYKDNQWNKLNTSKVSESTDKITYEAQTPGFSYFAVSGEEKVEEEEEVKECPTCPEPTQWSECVNGTQTRTNYRCSAQTNYTCESYQEEETCVPEKKPAKKPPYLWAVIAVLIIIGVSVILYYYKRKKRESSPYDMELEY